MVRPHSSPPWRAVQVTELGEVVAGKALNAQGPGIQTPYLRTANVLDGQIVLHDVLAMPFTEDEYRRYELRPGDVLLNEGQSLPLVGRCAMYQGEHQGRCAIQNQLLRFRANAQTLPAFATHMFRRCQQNGTFATIATQTTSVAHLGVERFKALRLPWPTSLPEQRAIAEALGDVDALLDSLDRLIAKKRDLKQGAMQQLLTGKTRLPGFNKNVGTTETEAGVLPQDWSLCQLGELAQSVSYGSSAKSRPSGDMPVLRMGNLQDGKLDWEDLVFASDPVEIRQYTLSPGDVLFNRTNTVDLVGKTAIYEGERPAIFAGYLIRIVTKRELLDPWYLNYIMGTPLARKHSTIVLSVAVGQANINSQKLKTYPIPLPPLKEQQAIVGALRDMDGEIRSLEQRRNKTRLLKQGVMQELLTESPRKSRRQFYLNPTTMAGFASC